MLKIGNIVKTNDYYNNHRLIKSKPIEKGKIIAINENNVVTVKIGRNERQINISWLELYK